VQSDWVSATSTLTKHTTIGANQSQIKEKVIVQWKTFYAFWPFNYTTMTFWWLEMQTFEKRFQSESFFDKVVICTKKKKLFRL